MYKIIILILSLILVGCKKTPNEIALDEIIQEMGWLYDADPNTDYISSIKKKDYRFMGLYGVGSYVPGINKECLDHDKDINFIVGTSDARDGYEHSKLIAIAEVYSKNYNFQMLNYLRKNNTVLYKKVQCKN